MTATKRQLQKEHTRKRIVAAAYQLYAKQGFSTSTSEIARAIGVSHGTIFAHFPTKEGLLMVLIEDFGTRMNARLHESTEKSKTVKDMLNAHLDALAEEEAFYTRLIAETHLLPAAVRHIFVGIQTTSAFHLGQMLEKERHEGKIKSVPDAFLFNLWIGLIHYYLQNKVLFSPDTSVIKRYRDDFVRYFLEMLKEKNE